MSEAEQATSGQEQETGQVQETTEGTQQTQEQETGQAPGQGQAASIDELPKWVQDEIKNLRKENADRRTKLKEIEDRDKSELQKITEERDGLLTERQKWQQERTANAFRSQINLPSPGLALGAAREMGVAIELDDKGSVKNIDAIRKQLKTQYPREFGDGSADGAETGGTRQGGDMNSQIRAAAGRS